MWLHLLMSFFKSILDVSHAHQHSRKNQFMFIWAPYCLHFGIMGRIGENVAFEPLRCERWHELTLTGTWCLDPAFNSRRIHSRLGDVCFNAHKHIYIYIFNYIYIHIFVYVSLYIFICEFFLPSFPTKSTKKRGVTSTQHLLMLNLRVKKKNEAKRECHVIFISKARKIWNQASWKIWKLVLGGSFS